MSRTPKSFRAAVLALSVCVIAGLHAGQAPAPDPPPVFRTGIDVVIVEATATDRRGIVTDLTAADFEVEIGGERREIVSAELVEHLAASGGADAPSAGPDVSVNTEAVTGRRILVVADQSSLGPDSRTIVDAARRWLRTLGATDRVGLVALPPPGPVVEFTTDHRLIDQALTKVMPSGGVPPAAFSVKNIGLWEAVRINERDALTRELVIERECIPSDRTCPFEIDAAARDIAADVFSRMGPMLGSLRNMLLALRAIPGPKHLVLLSAGWPIDPQSLGSDLEPLAAAAASANVMLHTLLSERSSTEAFMRRLSPTSVQDRNMLQSSVEALAGWTGGQSARVVGSGDSAFDALNKALTGYYRLGVRPAPEDLDGKTRRISVKVRRSGVSIRSHRRVFAAAAEAVPPPPTDPSAALRAAILSAVPQTGLALRATSYVLHEDEQAPDRLRLLVAGDVSGGAAGAATVRIALFDDNGRFVNGADRDIELPADGPARLSATLSAPPGVYALRIAARDSQGRMGSVQRDIHLRWRPGGGIETTDLALFRVGAATGQSPSPVVDVVRRDERLIAQLAISDPAHGNAGPEPVVEISPEGSSTPLVRQPLRVDRLGDGPRWLAQETMAAGLLPPGRYIVTVHLRPGVPPLSRQVEVVAESGSPPAELTAADAARPVAAAPAVSTRLALTALAKPAPFDRARVLDAERVAPLFSQLAARADAAPVRDALEGMTAGPWPTDARTGALSGAPVAAHFVAGLGRLHAGELEAAATEFRHALRAAPDFAPAMAYLAACFAAGGKDKEAAGAFQAALVRERDSPFLQQLAIEAWLRAERPAAALALVKQARQRFPDDESFVRLQAAAELAQGQVREGLETMESVTAPGAPLLLMALATVYNTSSAGTPVWDGERDLAAMKRWREAYVAAGGDSVALVDAWLAEMSAARR